MKSDNLCRCCLSVDCFKDISNEYVVGGHKVVYADLLLDTFNLKISYLDSESRLICEPCTNKIRDAAAFRRQVEHAEAALNGTLDAALPEPHYTEPQDDFLDHITGEFEYDDDDGAQGSGDEFQWPTDGGEVFAVKMEPDDDDDAILEIQRKNQTVCKKNKLSGQKKAVKNEKNKQEKRKTDETRRSKTLTHMNMKENSLKLINNSNLLLFESLKTKFRCFYCKNFYLNIKELREHSVTHSNPSYLKMCINRLQGMSFKNVDISNLNCKLCTEPLNDLTDLKTHLTEKHQIEFANEKHMLIPYKLENGFNCALCEQKFNTFFRLSIHMNTHFTNHVCEICGLFYINRLSLRMHVNSMHKEKKCSVCPAIFSNTYSRVKHMRKVHNSSQVKRYCLLCNKTFRYTYMLEEHKIQEHGMKRQVSVCQECGKSFLTPVNLKTHIRAVHIKERNHHCTFCGMSFFTSSDQRRHERTHQDIRLFACGFCEGRFKSKDSLRRHLKRQHGNVVLAGTSQL